MRCFRVTVEYDGTDFAGLQYQAEQRTVQGELERAIRKITGQELRIQAAGRTDSGVHALGQVIGFRAETRIPVAQLPLAMNSALPADVRAVAAAEVEPEFHARFSARSRAYVYVILNRRYPSALFGRYTCHVPDRLDESAMQRAARLLEGTQDFAAWANATREVRSTIRTVTACRLRRTGAFLLLRMEADGFLHGVVRNVAGTLLEVGSGTRSVEDILRITASRDRSQAGPSAPARGLCLVKVRYGGDPAASRPEADESPDG